MWICCWRTESIKCSGGGVSERAEVRLRLILRVYQVFRWWGVGTLRDEGIGIYLSLSSVPVVGCRNNGVLMAARQAESIKCSGGGVSEPVGTITAQTS